MKRIIVLQLARLGDMVQTIPFLQALKCDSESEVTLLVDKRLAEGIKGALPVEEVIALDLPMLSRTISKNDLLSEYQQFSQVFQPLRSRDFDIVYNLNRSRWNALIISQLNFRQVQGFIPRDKAEDYQYSPSLRILFNQSRHRRLARMHLADCFRYLLSQPPPMNFPLFRVSDSNNGFALTALEKLRAEGFSPLIALHLGAGAEFRNWGALNFAHTMRILLQESNLGIVLIGSNKSEADLVLDGLDTQNGIINLIGKTDIDQLAGVLAQVDLLIGVDSGPLHLACAVGTKTLGLYFASAWLYETGPLGEGHYILQAHPDCTPCVEDEPTCDHCPCRDKINPALVARTILKIMANDEWNDLDLPPEVTLFQTQIDDLGQYYHPLKGEFKDGAKFYHTLWPSFFENLQHLKLTTDD